MKNWLTPLALSLSVLLVGGMWLRGQSAPPAAGGGKDKEKRTVTTAGSATIRIKPDSARLFLSVQTSAPTIKEARAENAARFGKVKAALAALQIPELKMKTSDITLDPEYSRPTDNSAPKVTGYRVTNQFTVLVTDPDVNKLSENASKLMDTALEQGVNVVSRVAFFRADDSAIRREVMTKAVESAVVNAKALTAGIKADVFETIAIGDSPTFYWGDRTSNTQRAFNADAGEESQFVAGDIEVTCRVTVTCTY